MAEKFKDQKKKVGLVEMSSKLIAPINGAHELVMPYLQKLGVRVHLNTPYNGEETLQKLGYDFVINCCGFRFNAPRQYMQGDLADCLEPKTG